jgi:hypothetical protein
MSGVPFNTIPGICVGLATYAWEINGACLPRVSCDQTPGTSAGT